MSFMFYILLKAWQWMLENTIGISTLVLVTTVIIVKLWSLNCRLPPGPWGVPFFGSLFSLKGSPHLVYYCNLAKKYGRIFSVRLGTQIVVVISDYSVIRDIFRSEYYTGRPHTEFTKILGGYGLINVDGALWKDQRKFLHKKLVMFGMNKFKGNNNRENLLSKISVEVDTLIRRLKKRSGEATNISPFLAMSISNVICSLIMGVQFEHDSGETRFERFMGLIEEGFKLFGSMDIINYISIMRFLPWMQINKSKISKNRTEMAEFFQETVDQHRETFKEGEVRDIVDAYLVEIQKAREQGQEDKLFEGKNHNRQIQQILGDLFSAGMETIKTTLEWAVLLMLHHPEMARAVQEELDRVVGRSRMPSYEDISSLPITVATIHEVLRKCSIVPLGTTHAATRDLTLEGYTIPAGTQIVPLLYAVHMNPELWDEPEEFRPSRFLDSNGEIETPPYFMPFGVGKRMCLGEMLARMELFTFFSSLMHTFDLRMPEGASLPSLKGNAGVTLSPDPYEVCLVYRGLECSEIVNNPLRNIGSH